MLFLPDKGFNWFHVSAVQVRLKLNIRAILSGDPPLPGSWYPAAHPFAIVHVAFTELFLQGWLLDQYNKEMEE